MGATGSNGGTGAMGPTGRQWDRLARRDGLVLPALDFIMGGSGGSVAGSATVFTGLDSQNAIEGNVQQVMGAHRR